MNDADQVRVAVRRVDPGADEHAAAHALLRALLRLSLPAAAGAPVAYDRRGAPYLDGAEHVGISVSHDGGWVAAAAAPGLRVGVDVQVPVHGSFARLGDRCLRARASDVARLLAPARDVEIAWVWTAQEACVKARGTGLAGRPWALDVVPFTDAGSDGAASWRSLRGTSPVPLSVAALPAPPTTARPTTERETA